VAGRVMSIAAPFVGVSDGLYSSASIAEVFGRVAATVIA